MSEDNMAIYFSGQKLYGDDFTLDQIQEWYRDEQEGYADLGARNRQNYHYVYHELNKRHLYSHISTRRFSHALGLGSAYGDEFAPIIQQLDNITILDPSDAFSNIQEINGVPCEYHKPNIDGRIPFEDGKFDLITCFGVLHHIANVSDVVQECHRCLNVDGIMLIREPIVSMGDWRRPRVGLTKRERGIPYRVFEEIIGASGFKIRHKALCDFSAIPKLGKKLGIAVYNNSIATFLDEILSRAFSWNIMYHRTNVLSKLGPASASFVLVKD